MKCRRQCSSRRGSSLVFAREDGPTLTRLEKARPEKADAFPALSGGGHLPSWPKLLDSTTDACSTILVRPPWTLGRTRNIPSVGNLLNIEDTQSVKKKAERLGRLQIIKNTTRMENTLSRSCTHKHMRVAEKAIRADEAATHLYLTTRLALLAARPYQSCHPHPQDAFSTATLPSSVYSP